MDEKRSRWERELPPSIQFAALTALWIVWAAAVGYVVIRERRLNEEWRYYDNPALIYSLLLFWEPLPLIVINEIFLRRLPKADRRRYLIVRLVVTALTLSGLVAVMFGCVACLMQPGRIRE